MLLKIVLILCILKCIYSKTSIVTHPKVELVENVPLNSLVVSFSSFTTTRRRNESNKMVLLNLNGYEKEMFLLMNETIYTKEEIDREEFVLKGYCRNEMNCQIEIHILVNDGEGYWIIPIDIVE